MNNGKVVLSVKEVSEKLGVSKNLGYKLCKERQIPGVIQLGPKKMVVSQVAFDNLIQGK